MIASAEYFEMPGDRAIYQDGWMAVTTLANLLWELNTATPPDVVFREILRPQAPQNYWRRGATVTTAGCCPK